MSISIHDYDDSVSFTDPDFSCQYGQQEREIRSWPYDVGQGLSFRMQINCAAV